MRHYKKIWKTYISRFGSTIFHPQYNIIKYNKQSILEAVSVASRVKNLKVIDLGCGDMNYREMFEKYGSYTSLDHPMISKIYLPNNKIDIKADLNYKLPISRNSFNMAVSFQVIEYLDSLDNFFSEVHRILKPGGYVVISSPFFYPLHDIPWDKNRLTEYSIKYYLKKHKFKGIVITPNGFIAETIALLCNVFLFRKIESWIESKSTANTVKTFILGPAIVFVCIMLNLLSQISKRISKANVDALFPIQYTVFAKK